MSGGALAKTFRIHHGAVRLPPLSSLMIQAATWQIIRCVNPTPAVPGLTLVGGAQDRLKQPEWLHKRGKRGSTWISRTAGRSGSLWTLRVAVVIPGHRIMPRHE